MQLRGSQLESGSIVGGYRIDELISRGGMGVVYRATNVALNRIYALKVLAPELADDDRFRERFKREMRIAASLDHANIVGIHYAGDHDGLLFFVMDYVTGSDLRDLLKKAGALEPNRAVDLLAQFASALDAAHGRGLVHRDVKPANVLITVSDGVEHAYLTDFGVAKRSDTVAGLTAKGAVVGTVDYMSPEQISGERTDARTDIYALGCVFFQMLIGKVPYERENSVAKLFAHVHEPPPPLEGPLADLYPVFGTVIEKAMAKEPEDRYLSAGDFARDAAAALSGTRYTGPPSIVATGDAGLPASHDPTGTTDWPEPTPISVPLPPASVAPETATRASVAPEPATRASVAPEPVAGPASVAPEPVAGPAGPSVPGAPPTGYPPPSTPDLGPPHAERRSLKRYRWPAAAVLLVAVGAVAAIIASGSGSSPTSTAGRGFSATAKPVPTNRVTGSGTATVRLNGNVATVTVDTTGLLAGVPHAMHIHAGGQGVCPPATAARLHNGHLSISTTNGIKFYGPPQVALTSHGDSSPKSIVDFSRYPAVGSIRYKRTLVVPPGVADAIRAGNAVIVVHGIDYNGNGIYDNVLDRSELDNALPGEATAPAICGPLFNSQAQAGVSGPHSPGATYTASLGTEDTSRAEASDSLWLLCHLAGLAPATPAPTAPASTA